MLTPIGEGVGAAENFSVPVYCVRHGQSVANAGGLTMEHSAIPLSPLGIAQAATLAAVFDVEPSLVLVSSYLRAIETAEPFCARHDCLSEIEPLLREFSALDANELQGMDGAERRPLADAYWQACDPALRSGPGAETFFEFDARVEAFACTLPSVPERTVLFGHGIWFALLFWKLGGGDAIVTPRGMATFRRFQLALPMPNCAVFALELQPGGQWSAKADARVRHAIEHIGPVEASTRAGFSETLQQDCAAQVVHSDGAPFTDRNA